MNNKFREEYMGEYISDRYEIMHAIGKGANSIVYLVKDHKLGKLWAAKKIRHLNPMEVEVLKCVCHELFPRITDYIETDDAVYIVMDYVEGTPLSIYCKDRTIGREQIIEWGMQIAEGLRFLHTMKVPALYLDCKPDNIILCADGKLKIVDFGSIYIRDCGERQRISGTVPYASPEQRKCMELDERSDIYSLGMTLLRIGYGMRKEIRYIDGNPTIQGNNAIGRDIIAVIDRCLQYDRDNRYNSMESIVYDLRKCQKNEEVRSPYRNSVRMEMVLRLIIKLECTITTVMLIPIGASRGDWAFWCIASVILICMLRYPLYGRGIDWECKREVFRGNGSILPLLTLMLLMFALFASNLTSKANEMDSTYITQPQYIGMKNSTINIKNKSGYNILYSGQNVYQIGNDICIEIPFDAIDADSIPASIEYLQAE